MFLTGFENLRKQLSLSLSASSMLCGLLTSWQCLEEEEGERDAAVSVVSPGQSVEGLGPQQSCCSPRGVTQEQEARQICFHVWVNQEIRVAALTR